MINDLEKRMKKLDIRIRVTDATREHISARALTLSMGLDPWKGPLGG